MKGFFYVSLLLDILKEVTGSSLIQKTDSDEEVALLLDTVQKVFQKMLECIARSFKKQPEEGLRVLRPPQDGFARWTFQGWVHPHRCVSPGCAVDARVTCSGVWEVPGGEVR